MRELSLYSTQSLPHTILRIFAPFVSILSKVPKMAIKPIKPIKPSGLPGYRASFWVEPELVWVVKTTGNHHLTRSGSVANRPRSVVIRTLV
jgi:hypothetical protein